MTDSADAASPALNRGNLPELSVSELAGAVKRTVEARFDRVRVRGELGRVTLAKSGHMYADLKDENASVSIVMWAGEVRRLRFKPEEGFEVVVEGRLTTTPGRSQYQIIIERMEPAGVGALLAQLERLKQQLAGEGLFAPSRKKPIPYLPQTIGIVTSPTGAVIRDILHRLQARFPRRVLLWPVLVQGERAAAQIAGAIRGFNRLEGDLRPDVLIVARGGGSIEDLWAFNEEIVVRAAAESGIPLISAIGHETDTTLIDHAADQRAPTPTAAAEMAVPVRAELLARVEEAQGRLAGGLLRGLERRRLGLERARLPRPEGLLGPASQKFDRCSEKLDAAAKARLEAAGHRLARAAAALRPQNLTRDLARQSGRLEGAGARLAGGLSANLRAHEQLLERIGAKLRPEALSLAYKHARLDKAAALLESLSHKSVLARGFALISREGDLLRAKSEVQAGDRLTISFADGDLPATAGAGASAPLRPRPRRKAAADDKQGDLF